MLVVFRDTLRTELDLFKLNLPPQNVLMKAIFFFSKEVFIECYNIAQFCVLGFCPPGMWDHSSLTGDLTKIIILFPFYGR